MLSRAFFFIVFGLILAVAGSFLAVVLFFGDGSGSSAGRPNAPALGTIAAAGTFEGRTPAWTVRGRLIETPMGIVRIEFQVQDRNNGPMPKDARVDVGFEMVGHAMPPTRATVEHLAPGVYRATGPVTMSGRWRIDIRLPDGTFQHVIDIGR
ncbi:MAG: FixH family protein [Alphaproteobacteria bacterium]|nr:FixH family protein [Alphaproteobacteria bacterium]MBM3949971.1 FixH family protein [Rhodospirillales bacterium]